MMKSPDVSLTKKFDLSPSRVLWPSCNSSDFSNPMTLSLQLLKHVTIASGGVLPKILPELIGRKKGNKFPNSLLPLGSKPAAAAAPPKPKKAKVVDSSSPSSSAKVAKKPSPKKLSVVSVKGKPSKVKGGKVKVSIFQCFLNRYADRYTIWYIMKWHLVQVHGYF